MFSRRRGFTKEENYFFVGGNNKCTGSRKTSATALACATRAVAAALDLHPGAVYVDAVEPFDVDALSADVDEPYMDKHAQLPSGMRAIPKPFVGAACRRDVIGRHHRTTGGHRGAGGGSPGAAQK